MKLRKMITKMALGVDIVQISRIKDVEVLAKGILSKREYDIYLKKPNKCEFIAGRFAAKEAFCKAKEEGLKISLKSIEVLYKDNGSPFIEYEGKKIDVSIAHDGDYAIAVVNL